MDGDPTSEEQSTTPAWVDPPVIRRLRTVMHKLNEFVSTPTPGKTERSDKYARYSWVISSIMDEILDEMAESNADPEVIGQWFAQMGQVIQWCGSGDDAVLPMSVRKFLSDNEPELLAITTGE